MQLTQQGQDRRARRAVQIAGWFVRQDQIGPADEGAGDRDALALTSGQRPGPVGEPVPKPDPLERLRGRAAPGAGRSPR